MRRRTLFRKRLWHWCYPVNFTKDVFYRTPPGDYFWIIFSVFVKTLSSTSDKWWFKSKQKIERSYQKSSVKTRMLEIFFVKIMMNYNFLSNICFIDGIHPLIFSVKMYIVWFRLIWFLKKYLCENCFVLSPSPVSIEYRVVDWF